MASWLVRSCLVSRRQYYASVIRFGSRTSPKSIDHEGLGESRAETSQSTLASGSSGPGSGPGLGHCVVFLGKTRYSHSNINGYRRPSCWGNPAMD